MEMKRIIKLFIKYRLYIPWQFIRFIYYNLIKCERKKRKAVFFPSRNSVFDVSYSARIVLTQVVEFGWCNMHKSKLETALCMQEHSLLNFNGGCKIGYGSYIQIGKDAELQIGNSFINREVKIICNKKISIGNGCIIAMGTVIRDNDGGNHKIKSPDYVNCKPVTIGNNVWIGENVMILKGVTIGEGCVIGANSLVTKDIPPHCLAIGSPAKVVRTNIQWES